MYQKEIKVKSYSRTRNGIKETVAEHHRYVWVY